MIPPDLQVSDRWKLRTKTLYAGRIPLLMGVINVTPDSFSNGGKYFDPERAIEHGLKLIGQGADILDIGGQSTRPGAEPISAQEELRRVLPVITELCRLASVPISIDTFEPGVAHEALNVGAEAINDITALTNPEMLKLVVASGCGVCAMHMLGTPQTMQDNPEYEDVVIEVLQFLRERRDAIVAAGVETARIALDPGIGFGKTTEHNLALMSNAWRFHALNCPVLVGHSRKRFIGRVVSLKNVGTAIDKSVGMVVDRTAESAIDKSVGMVVDRTAEAAIDKTVGAAVDKTNVGVIVDKTNVGVTVELSPQHSSLPPQQFDPLPGTIGAALALARQGVQILRVHDVAAVRHALLLFDACGGR